MLAYNGSIPGPVFRIKQHSEVTINLINKIDMETTLHAHGVRMESAFDGVPGISQEAVKPGELFTYRLKFPDAGIFWYHPHVRTDYQVEHGLYGAIVVEPETPLYWGLVNREEVLVIDDLLLEDGRITFDKKRITHTLMGRFGNKMLINGETDYSFAALQGETVRFYLVNAANARPFNIGILGARLKLVGAEAGAYERDSWTDEVLLGPGERAIVEATFDTSGEFAIENRTPERTYVLGSVRVSDASVASRVAEFETLETHEKTILDIDSFRSYFDRAPDKKIRFSIAMGARGNHMMSGGSMMGGMDSMMGVPAGGLPAQAGIEWEDTGPMMNAMSDEGVVKWQIIDEDTKRINMDINWTLKRGVPLKIRIVNDATSMHSMQHPFHMHGQRFLVLSRLPAGQAGGTPEKNLAWKDTVLVKAGETVDILLDTSNPGAWMAHCHILEHAEAGMMFSFKIE